MKKFSSVLLILFLGVQLVLAEELKKDFHQTFDVQRGTVLHLRHGDGDVKIRPWDRDVVDVKVRYHIEFHSIGLGGIQDFAVEFRQTRDDITVIGREKGKAGIRSGFHTLHYVEYVYEISAPPYVELDIDGDDGDIELSDWQADIDMRVDDGDVDLEGIEAGHIRIKTEDGDIRLVNFEADLRIRTDDGDVLLRDFESRDCLITGVDGEIRIRDGAGNLEIEMDDGDVDILDFRPQRVRVRTADGDVNIGILDVDNFDLDVTTDDGRVLVSFDENASARFSLQTDEGRMRVDVPEARLEDDNRHRKSGEFRGGKGRIRIRTVDGDIILRED